MFGGYMGKRGWDAVQAAVSNGTLWYRDNPVDTDGNPLLQPTNK